MYYERKHDCIDCKDCIDDPENISCNTACSNTKKNCYENYKVFAPKIYARANICVQPYENLFKIDEAFAAGTIFKDLYSPYCDVKYYGGDTL